MQIVFFSHSAKGSTWEDHKYVKRIDGTYYYPSGYDKGRTIDSLKESDKESSDDSPNYSSDDIENLALETIRGNFANGADRKALLGEYYSEVQSRVNELMKQYGSSSINNASSDVVEAGEEAVSLALSKRKKIAVEEKVVSGINRKEVFKIYDRKK